MLRKPEESWKMHNNILQQFGHSMLSPSYNKNLTSLPERSYLGQSLPQYNNSTNGNCVDKENIQHSAINMMSTRNTALNMTSSPNFALNMSAVLSGTGTTASGPCRDSESAGYTSPPLEDFNRALPYTAYNFMAYKQRTMLNNDGFNKLGSPKSEDETESDTHEHLRTGDMPNSTDTSLSTQESTSPKPSDSPNSSTPSSSSPSSPSSGSEKSSPVERVTSSPESVSKPTKKNGRTSYTNDQIQTLLKLFHENPYPDSEMMEKISLDLGVPEGKIKIWFQNKRARWRKRVNQGAFPQPFMPMSPMFSPVGPYGFMPTGHMMTSPSPLMLPGYYHYPGTHAQTPAYPGLPTNNAHASSRMQLSYPPVTTSSQQFPMIPHQQAMTSALPYASRTSPPLPPMTSQTERLLQYSQFHCPS